MPRCLSLSPHTHKHAHASYSVCLSLHPLPNFFTMLYVSLPDPMRPCLQPSMFLRSEPSKLQSPTRLPFPENRKEKLFVLFVPLLQYIQSCAALCGSSSERRPHPKKARYRKSPSSTRRTSNAILNGNQRAQGRRLLHKSSEALLMTFLSPDSVLLSFPSPLLLCSHSALLTTPLAFRQCPPKKTIVASV